MKIGALDCTMTMIGKALEFYIADTRDRFAVGHEMAHAILLFGKVFLGNDELTGDRCDAMSLTSKNDHEMHTVALHLAGLKALGCPASSCHLAKLSYGGLEGRRSRKKYRRLADYHRAIVAHRPSRRDIARFVKVVRAFARYL